MDLFDIPVQYRTMKEAQERYDNMEPPEFLDADESIDEEPDYLFWDLM